MVQIIINHSHSILQYHHHTISYREHYTTSPILPIVQHSAIQSNVWVVVLQYLTLFCQLAITLITIRLGRKAASGHHNSDTHNNEHSPAQLSTAHQAVVAVKMYWQQGSLGKCQMSFVERKKASVLEIPGPIYGPSLPLLHHNSSAYSMSHIVGNVQMCSKCLKCTVRMHGGQLQSVRFYFCFIC